MKKVRNIKFLVEGKEDIRFLKDFIFHHFKITLQDDSFFSNEGKSEKLNDNTNLIKSTFNDVQNAILIFDADDTDYRSTIKNIQQQSLDIDFETFLFPNNKDKGNLETLLRNIVTEKDLFGCIDSYVNCIDSLEIARMKPTVEKTKMFIYLDSLLQEAAPKGTKRDYLMRNVWNLDSEYLIPLKNFLFPYFDGK